MNSDTKVCLECGDDYDESACPNCGATAYDIVDRDTLEEMRSIGMEGD